MFWFDQNNPDVLFVDKRVVQPRIVGKGKDARVRKVLPDKVMDFRAPLFGHPSGKAQKTHWVCFMKN